MRTYKRARQFIFTPEQEGSRAPVSLAELGLRRPGLSIFSKMFRQIALPYRTSILYYRNNIDK